MPEAYVLLNTEIGAEREVLKNLKRIEGVQEAFNLTGIYDIIAKVKTDTADKLAQVVTEKLQVNKVHSKLTIIVTEP